MGKPVASRNCSVIYTPGAAQKKTMNMRGTFLKKKALSYDCGSLQALLTDT